MIKYYPLPLGCILRPARASDRLAIWTLLIGLSRGGIPISSSYHLILLAVTRVLVIAAVILIMSFYLFKIVDLGLSDREIFLLCIVFSGFLPFGIFFKFLKKYNPFVKQIDYLESRVVECSGRLVAYAKMFNCNDLKILQYLYVTPHYRKQGIGSYIIQNLIQEATKPIYLVAALGKTRYYTRLGFVKLRFNQLAPTVQRKLRQAGISYYFSLRLLVYDRNQK